MRRLAFVVSLLAAIGLALPAVAATTITGEKKGAFFTITVPDVWNGDLVIDNHGFDFDAPAPNPGFSIGGALLAQGYAVAASSYSQCCWALFQSQQDIQRMVDVFIAEFGEPDRVFVTGFSLGGIITAQIVEKLGSTLNIVGAYPLCGALSGSRSWDGALDLRLTYDVICGGVAPIPGGATGIPAPGHPDSPIGQLDVLVATSVCMGTPFGFLAAPGAADRLADFTAATQLPVSFVATDMVFGTLGVSNVVFEDGKLDGENGLSNIGVTYSDPTIDAAIERVTPVNKARKRLQRYYTPKGDVGDTKIVSVHTDGDGLVIVENEKEYQDVVPASNLTVAIVDEAGNTHCGFTDAEIFAGWQSLVGWVDGGPQPTPTSIQNTCQYLQLLGISGPCRYDPGYVIPDMDGRIAPR